MRIGIASLAHHHAESYARVLRSLPGLDFIGISDEDRRRGEGFCRAEGLRLFASHAELIAERPDAIIVASENSRHRGIVEAAAAAGICVLCEKPLATSVADAEAMVHACRKAGVVLMTAFPMRFSPPVLEAKARLEAGELGRPRCVVSSNQGQFPRKHREWFVDPVLAGGGALVDHLVHLADLLRWCLGREPGEVYAQSNRIFHGGEVEVETGGVAMLGFEGGVFASIDFSWSRPESWPSWGGLSFELVGDRGAIRVDGFRQNLSLYPASEGRMSWLPWGSDLDASMLAAFVAAVADGRSAGPSGEDGLVAVRVVAAALESARLGRSVALSSMP